MNNLFVCHSQYQLLLSTGLCSCRFINDINDIILFVDFKISNNLRNIILNNFSSVLFLKGAYPEENKKWRKKIIQYPKDIKLCTKFINKKYDRIFLVCDENIPEYYILKKAINLNSSIECCSLEDGSHQYYKNIVQLTGLAKYPLTRWLRKFTLKYILGFRGLVDFRAKEMGESHVLTSLYLTYPGQERSIFKNKNLIGITNNELKTGINTLYPPKNINSLMDNSVLIAMDKLDTYHSLDSIKKTILEICQEFKDRTIYYKYHPREEFELIELSEYIELDRYTAIENFYSSSLNKDIIIIGIKSTSLQTSKKLGFQTISYAQKSKELNQDIIRFYNNIGINVR